MSSFSTFSPKRAISALVITIILSACGGGGGGNSEPGAGTQTDALASKTGKPAKGSSASPVDRPSSEIPAEQTDRNEPLQALTIDYYGDSTIWGYESGTGARVATPAPAAFAAALPTPSRHTVRNEGVNSTDACQLLNGQDGQHPAWDTQMASSNADIVIINHAINDQWRMSVDQYKSCLTSLAVKAKAHGKKIVFETPNPTLNDMSAYMNAMKAVAAQQGVPVIDQYSYLLNYLDGKSPYTICPDGLHPTDEVYVLKGKYAAKVFASLNY
ncbi:SGNH/GDSL hydrolase family protein [Oxalobacteraceae bacterium R-40]|uniref:SGNH/GDSL hydrolase family protein n=1 Tax=Keguizhuia sedimenti TaxID=3064264 RepID=A0ABU1BJQ7_9BURK|nr:SGNH/GDSL hydrolase family protein [Oxalobacteraceae bacterium R-40]